MIKNSNLSERIKIYQRYCQGLTPQSIHDLKTQAWGFDFFRPKQTMILRFDRYFHSRYIEGTERDKQFQQISFQEVQYFIKNNHQVEQHHSLLQKLQTKSHDIYCRIDYREGDYNVIMRLRAWGSNVEVLTPTTLRNEMSKEFQKLAAIYT